MIKNKNIKPFFFQYVIILQKLNWKSWWLCNLSMRFLIHQQWEIIISSLLSKKGK